MSLEGRSPYGVSDDATVGTVTWTCAAGDLDNDDGTESSVVLSSGNQSHYLKAIQCGFTIPAGATISGIQVSILRRVSNAAGGMYPSVRDAALYITYLGGNWSGNLADTGTDWPAAEAEADYGGPSTNLAPALTAAELNATSFGVLLSLSATGGAVPVTAYIDRVVIQITYTAAETLQSAGAEYVEAEPPDEPTLAEYAAAGIAGDDYNAPPSTDAVTLIQSESMAWQDEDEQHTPHVIADASSASMLDGLADAMIGAAVVLDEGSAELVASGVDLVGALWLTDGPLCDCGGTALVVRSGYGTALVRSFAATSGAAAAFGSATIRGGYGTAKIIVSCEC